jgi:hypothetical protein
MAANGRADQPPQTHLTIGQKIKRTGLFVLFGALLIIPRIRRLRRRVWAWSFVRLGVAACATWLGWRYKHAGAGPATLALSLILFAFSLLVRVKPEEKSADVLARELNALIVLNGGAFRQSPDSLLVAPSEIYVCPAEIIVVGPKERRLLEIPFARVRNLVAHGVADGAGKAEDWVVEITWLDDEPCATTFEYQGTFAEHLARVTESTLRSQWIKDLPVIPS